MNRKKLIAGIFRQHMDKGMIHFSGSLAKAGFVPIAACQGHRPIFSLWNLRPDMPTPFYGWPPFFYFSGEESRARDFYRRIRESIGASRISEDWRMMGIFSPVGGRLDWLLFNPGVFGTLLWMEYPFRFRQKLKKDLRVIESLLEGLDKIVPEGVCKEFDFSHDNPCPSSGDRVMIPGIPRFQDDVKKEDGKDQKYKATEQFFEKLHETSMQDPDPGEREDRK